MWHCRHLPYSYKIFYKILQQNSLSRSRSRLNHSPSMRYEVEFKSSQYLSSPDESKDKEGLPVPEHWGCWQAVHLSWPQPGGEGDCHLCTSVLELCRKFISCCQEPSWNSVYFSSMGTTPEVLEIQVWCPSPFYMALEHKVSCQRATWHQKHLQLSQNYYRAFRERWCPRSTS